VERRRFVQSALSLAGQPAGKSHIVSLSFDDGFKKSFYKIAEIHESFGLRACLNVIAIGHTKEFDIGRLASGGANTNVPLGNFDDWNKLKRRGHEVMAHTYDHARLTDLPIAQARELIDKCAAYFESHLDGFKAAESIYSFAYNASNDALDEYALSKFRGIRTRGGAVNPLPPGRRAGCVSYGPGNCDAFLQAQIDRFLAAEGGWFVFNAHGLDEEGWGPMSSGFLTSLLARLVKLSHVAVLPVGAALLPRAVLGNR
jgi:peptidoglycan/xylan/chitin deacetylase (PgdA/CDA1 family)